MNSFLSAVVGAVLWLWGFPALAQTEADKARAETLFEEGKALMDDKSYPLACAKFQESYDLVRGIGAQYFLARCLTERGQTATAFAHFQEIAEISLRVGQQDRADVAAERIRELEPRLMKIRIDVTTPEPGLEVTCDGKVVPKSAWGQPLAYDPGSHLVTAKQIGGQTWERRVELQGEGVVRTVVVPDLRRPSAADSIDDPDTTRADPGTAMLISGIAVGALGVVGLGIAGGIAGAATSTYDDSDMFCDDTGCDPRGLELVDDARSLGDAATAMFVIGGVLLAGGTTLVILSVVQEDDTTPSAVVLPAEIRVGLGAASFRWHF